MTSKATPSEGLTDRSGLDLSVVVPCFNEEANLGNLVERIREAMTMANIASEIVLVDDCSRDRTRQIIEELSRRHPFVLGVFHERNQGIAGGWRSGLEASHAPAIAIMDADLQYAPEDLPRLYRIWQREKPDVVQGWRIAHNFKATYRYLLSLGFSLLLNKLFGTNLKDIKSGFLCTSRGTFKEMLETKHRYLFPQHFIVINAAAKGYSIRQEPVLFWNREAGESFITSPFRFGLRSLADLPHAFVEFRLNRRKRV